MAFDKKTQDPQDKLDYLNDWQPATDPFLAEDETITTSTWTAYTLDWAETDDVTLSNDSKTDTTTTVWVEGGASGDKFYITNHVVTSEGREKDRTFQLNIRQQ